MCLTNGEWCKVDIADRFDLVWQQCAKCCCAGSQQHVVFLEHTSCTGRDDFAFVYCTPRPSPQIMLASHTPMTAHVLQHNSGMNMAVVVHTSRIPCCLCMLEQQFDPPRWLEKSRRQLDTKAAQEVGPTNGHQSSSRSGASKWTPKQITKWVQSMQPKGSFKSMSSRSSETMLGCFGGHARRV